jgi:hypothetical protein
MKRWLIERGIDPERLCTCAGRRGKATDPKELDRLG